MEFEWDPLKAEANKKKHDLSFEIAVTAFDDPYALISIDEKHSAKEIRKWLIGESDTGVLVVIFTQRNSGKTYRIISARGANQRERKHYEIYKRFSF